MEAQNQFGARQGREQPDVRRHPRFKLEVDIKIYSRSCGLLLGRALDISESGMAAMLKIEVPLDEVVQLEFKLLLESVAIRAVVRQRNAFRYGFQFVEPDPAQELIRRSCCQLQPCS